jgi:hypothetical protein
MSRIAEGEAETACPLTCEPPRPHADTPQRDQVGDCPGRASAGGIGVVGIAIGEVAKRREEVVLALTPDCALCRSPDYAAPMSFPGTGAQSQLGITLQYKQR